MQDSKRDVEIEQRIGKFVRDFSFAVQDEQSVNYNILRKMLRELLASEISKAREGVLLELLEKKTNYKIERVDHGYKVTQEYVLVSDIEKELSKLKSKK